MQSRRPLSPSEAPCLNRNPTDLSGFPALAASKIGCGPFSVGLPRAAFGRAWQNGEPRGFFVFCLIGTSDQPCWLAEACQSYLLLLLLTHDPQL